MSSPDFDAETNLNLVFPLPYRVLSLIGLGILAWATNLHGLQLSGIDTAAALELRTEGYFNTANEYNRHRQHHQKHHVFPSPARSAVYRIFFAYAGFCFASWTIFRLCTKRDRVLIDAFGYIPMITGLVVLMALLSPFNVLLRHERDKFLNAIRRCLFAPSNAPVHFSDVVFADIMTSFAKVLGDVWLSLAMLFPGNSLLAAPAEEGWVRWILPIVMSLPYFVRFRQCIIEYGLPTNKSTRPLFNAVKYATAFPVIFLSAAQRRLPVIDSMSVESDVFAPPDRGTFRLWLFAAFINSIYSFWWDVTNDWGLEMLKKQADCDRHVRRILPRPLILPRLQSYSHASLLTESSQTSIESSDPKYSSRSSSPLSSRSYPWGLRATLLYPLPVYPLLIFFNLILRMTWSVKLSSHFYSISDGSVGIFCLEVAEIVRRWLWVFIRVEWEVIKKGQDGNSNNSLDRHDTDEQDYEMIPAIPGETMLLPA